ECRSMGRQPRVLNAGNERTEIEFRRRFRRRRQAAGRLLLRRVELELAPVEADEEGVLVRYAMIDTSREHVVGDITIDRRRVVVEIPGSVRKRIDAGDISADTVDAVGRNDVVWKWIAQELRVGRADRTRRVEIGIEARGQRIVNGDQVSAGVAEVAEIADPCLRCGNRVDEYLAALLFQSG